MDVQETAQTPAGASTETVSAGRAAAEAGNVGDFLQSQRDARTGNAHEAVTREVKEPKAKVEAKPTRWEKKADAPAGEKATGDKPAAAKSAGPTAQDRELDDRMRRIVGDATETLRRENAELKGRLDQIAKGAPGKAEPKAAAKAPENLTGAEIARYAAMPGAPKLDDVHPETGEYLYASANDHSIAMSQFISRTQAADSAKASEREKAVSSRAEREANRFKTFGERINGWKEKHADRLVDKQIVGNDGQPATIKAVPVSEEVAGLHGWAQLAHVNHDRQQRGLPPVPPSVDHGIAEHIYDCEDPAEIGVYLSDNPKELAYLRGAGSEADLAVRFGRVEERASATTSKTTAETTNVGTAGATTKPKTDAEVKREADRAVDRSVSSQKPPEHKLGRGTPSVDGEEQAISAGDVGSFLEIQRAKRVEAYTGRKASRRA